MNVQKLPKNLTFFFKKSQNMSFFKIGNFFEKMTIFVNFLKWYVKFLAIFGHSNDNFLEGQVQVVDQVAQVVVCSAYDICRDGFLADKGVLAVAPGVVPLAVRWPDLHAVLLVQVVWLVWRPIWEHYKLTNVGHLYLQIVLHVFSYVKSRISIDLDKRTTIIS